MAYFIFLKNSENIEGTIYKIAENLEHLNNLNLIQSDYKIIEVSQENFNSVKLQTKNAIKYNNDVIDFSDCQISFTKNELQNYVSYFKDNIKTFLNNNPNHTLFNLWNSYYNQLNNINLNNITYPLNKSLQQYFSDLNQPSFNILQLP